MSEEFSLFVNSAWLNCVLLMQYRMPDAYDHEGGVNQEKRFATLMQRYR